MELGPSKAHYSIHNRNRVTYPKGITEIRSFTVAKIEH